MKVPVVRGIIDRRMLVNFRVDPGRLRAILPAPFRPKVFRGAGLAGICLIRLKEIRPKGLPALVGFSSENAAHRIAVEWDEASGPREGVYVVRRDSSSMISTLAGGRIFPGVHHHASFEVEEGGGRYRLRMEADDGSARVKVEAEATAAWPAGSVFASLAEASAFFEAGSVGYSPASAPGCYDGLELRTEKWEVEPLAVREVESSFFQDPAAFPPGTAEFDDALLMRGIPHEWHGREGIRAGGSSSADAARSRTPRR